MRVALPMTVSVPLGPGATLLCAHGSSHAFNHRLSPETPAEQVTAHASSMPYADRWRDDWSRP